jgi:hypothetical protein
MSKQTPKQYKGSFTAREILSMFRNGMDSAAIAEVMLIPESSVATVLAVAREVERHYGNSDFAPASKRKSLMEGFQNWWDVPQPPIRKMEEISGMGDFGANQKRKDQGALQDDPVGREPNTA